MKQKIYTDDGVFFEYNLANLYSRMYAFLIDTFLLWTITGVISTLMLIFYTVSPKIHMVISTLVYFFLGQGYFIFFEYYWRGQTPGKRVVNIRVAHAGGLSLQFNQIMIRNIVRVVDSFPFFGFLGGAVSFFSNNHQRLGDMAAGTVVLDIKNEEIHSTESLPKNKYNSMLKYPHLCAKLRKLVVAEEVAFILELLHRKESVETDAIYDLYEKTKDHFQKQVPFPNEEIMNMSSEQYLVNVANIVTSRKYK